MRESTGRTEAASSGAESKHDSPQPDDPAKRRTESLRRAREEEAREDAAFATWLEHASDDLRDAWISVCPIAKDHSVMRFRLTNIVEYIRTGGPMKVITYGREREIDLKEKHADVVRRYRAGVGQARQINRLTMKKLIDALKLRADPEDVSPEITQPKGNEKRFIITAINWNGQRFPAPEGYVYKAPEVLGKKLADDAKKDIPAAIFAGYFKPDRNADNMVQSTGLFILDFDHVDNLERVAALIKKDVNVFLCFISITGSGLKVCVRGPATRNAVEYSAAYERIAAAKAKQWGLKAEIDRPTKDCSRLCFLSYDPNLYVNWEAVPVSLDHLPVENPEPSAENKPADSPKKSAKGEEPANQPQAGRNGLPLKIDWGEIHDLKWKGIPLGRCLDALLFIDPCCDRETWRIVGAALRLGYGDDAFNYFDLWSVHGGDVYESRDACWYTWQSHKRTGEGQAVVTPNSIFKMARQNGWKPASERPLVRTPSAAQAGDELDDQRQSQSCGADTDDPPLPSLNVSSGRDWNLIAADAVECLTRTDNQTVFLRDECGKHLVEVVTKPSGGDAPDKKPKLTDVRPVEFASLISRFARLVRLDAKGNFRRTAIDQKAAALIMAAAPMRELPVIRSLTSAPVLFLCRDGSLRIVGPGYDPHTGIYVTGSTKVTPTEDWEKGRDHLLGLAYDYKFPSEGDLARFIAAVLTPSLVVGQFLRDERVPLTVFEADDSQTGKGYATRLIGSVYGESPQRVVQKKGGGLGSLQDSFDAALLRGRPFISFDNMRDRLDLPCLESFATEDVYPARGFHKDYIEVNPSRYVIFMTSNGVSVTPDIVKRFNLIRFEKQPSGYKFWRDKQGRRLLPLVRDYQHLYQGAVWSVLTEWHRRGMPTTDEARHDFWAWSQSLDWIVQNLFKLPPLLDGFEEIQRRMVSEYWSFARQLCLAVKATGGFGKRIRAGELAGMCSDRDIKIPGLRSTAEDADVKQIGIIMKRLFKDTEDDALADIDDGVGKEQVLKVEGFSIKRIGEWSPSRNRSCVYVITQGV